VSWGSGEEAQSGSYRQLVIILSDNLRESPSALQKTDESYSYLALAKHMFKMNQRQKIVAPVSLNGSFYAAISLAFS
jgi:hypothetical protein